MTRILAPLLLLALAAPLTAQDADSLRLEPDRRASYIQGSIRGTLTYIERVFAELAAGDTAGAGAELRLVRGRVRATETHVLALRRLLEELSSDTTFTPPPADTTPPVDPSPPPVVRWTRVLRDTSIVGDVVVPAGQEWLIGPNVRLAGNLRTDSGTIALRSGSSLTFAEAPPSQYVGGGMRYAETFVNDWGIWVGGVGKLDIQGTPKTGWTQGEFHSTWLATDEIWIAPTAPRDYTARRWAPGDSVPRYDERVPPAELVNVSRDIEIVGGHIHISSSVPQTIEYVTLRTTGVLKPLLEEAGATTGRYSLHFHFMGDGSKGTLVRGVASIGAKTRVFVPHSSNGITFEDNVAVNSGAEVFWWDAYDRSDDITVNRLGALGVFTARTTLGSTPRFNAIVLQGGERISMTNSFAAGARGGSSSVGFGWPSNADNGGNAVWTFERNVAHNNEGAGNRLWFNDQDNHVQRDIVTYNNGGRGAENGAYASSNRWITGLYLDGVSWHSGSRAGEETGLPAGMSDVVLEHPTGPAISFGRFNKPSSTPNVFEDCTLKSGPGFPKVRIADENMANPYWIVFRDCNLVPSDISITAFPLTTEGSRVLIDNATGPNYEIRPDVPNRRVIVSEVEP